jgi:nucleoside-diphosphate-sugar epimerase
MTNVLITGRSGYIASSLRIHLKDKYNLTIVGRANLDLTDTSKVNQWFADKSFDVVIHTAIQGGHRLSKDDESVTDNNIKIYNNLLDNREKYTKLINIGSGAELYSLNTPYGYSKYSIRKSVLEQDGFYNIRAYGVFDENELDTRFIKSNIIKYIKKEPMVLHYDKKMDFFYMPDFVSLISHYIHNTNLPKEVDCSYSYVYHLSEILDKINRLGTYSVSIDYQHTGKQQNYTGKYTNFNIPYIGLDQGIQHTYQSLCNR